VVLLPRVPEAQFQATSFECQKLPISLVMQQNFGTISRVKPLITIPCSDSNGACGVDNDSISEQFLLPSKININNYLGLEEEEQGCCFLHSYFFLSENIQDLEIVYFATRLFIEKWY
jgi:hypothetical protein